MPRVSSDIITHKLSVYKEARPIAQKKHKLGEEKKLVAKEGIKKLLSVELIRKSRYTSWLANVVMVTKTNIIMPQGFSKHPRDKEKTAFMTNDANYYYEVMSFDLKNAEATYQWLMDKVFKGMIGWNVEVYMNDIVVKLVSFDQHIKDLEEVFEALRRTNMRLNPEKCAFGVEEVSS